MKISSFFGLFFVIVLGFVLSACAGLGSDQVLILSGYQSSLGVDRLPRRESLHNGIDFGDVPGTVVLAAADGEVADVSERPIRCGTGVLLIHRQFGRYTVYCHLSRYSVSIGQKVKRGDVIGRIGTTGYTGGISHVHFELCLYPCRYGTRDGSRGGTEDPLAVSAGCFDPKKTYPVDRLALTYPVRCKD